MTQVGNKLVSPYNIPVKRFAEAISKLRSTVDGSGGSNMQGGPDDQGSQGLHAVPTFPAMLASRARGIERTACGLPVRLL